jgi:protocatechuate 3,4-dioxygenase beta subunit
MTPVPRRRRSPLAWIVGLGVLVALGAATRAMLIAGVVPGTDVSSGVEVLVAREGDGTVALLQTVKEDTPSLPSVAGVVLRPDGRPAASATVSIYRLVTAWPEWRRERVDQAITGSDGAFLFRVQHRYGLLLGFEHEQFAGGLEPVQVADARMTLRLEPGFELFGFVTNPNGAVVPNARVAIESVLSDQRRVMSVTTAANGSYRFANLPAGPVRLVARHDTWQPVAVPVVVVGDQVRRDLAFERPAGQSLRGRVLSQNSQLPIEGAAIELLPANSRPGLADPIRARSAADGGFVLDNVPRGSARVTVRHDDYGNIVRTMRIGSTTSELTLEMPLSSQLSGKLVAGGAAAPWRGGEILEVTDEAGRVEFAPVGGGGEFDFGSATLTPGWASVRVLGREFSFVRSGQCEVSVHIETSARTEIELEVARPATVRGRVVDEAGEPLVGVAVSRTRQLAESARSIGSAVFDLDLGSLGSQVARLFRDDRDERLATSGADGAFEIRGPGDGPLLLRFDLPGRGSRWLRVEKRPDSADMGDVAMPRGCRIEGQVLRGDRGLAGAAVTVIGEQSQAVAVTRADGHYRVDDLLPGRYSVRARLPSAPTGSRDRDVVIEPDRPATNVLLVIEAGRTVRGVVTGTDGQPVPGALVSMRGAVGQIAMADSAGEFLFELPDRDVELQVSLADRSRPRLVPVPASQQRVSVELDTPPTCTLAARVQSLIGRKRMPGVLLRITPLDGGGDEAAVQSRWLDTPNGDLRWELCPAGRVRLEVRADDCAPLVVERDLAANEVHQLGDVLLEPGALLTGRVVDDRGAPVADAVVWLGEEGDLELFEPGVHTDGNGSFVIGGVTHLSSRGVATPPAPKPFRSAKGSSKIERSERESMVA